MTQFKVGDKVRCIQEGKKGMGWELGREFVIGTISSQQGVAFPPTGTSPEMKSCGVYLNSLELVNNQKSIMKRVSDMMKKLLDADTQALVKAGYINGDLELTTEGGKALTVILFVANKRALVDAANVTIAEEEDAR